MTLAHPFAVLLGLLGREGEEEIPICSQEPGGTGLHVDWVRADQAGEFVDTLSGRRHCWYGVQPTNRPDKGRGTSKSVTGLVALYTDLDFTKGDTGVGVDPVEALDVIAGLTEAIGIGPHAIVATGGGLHPYWAIERTDQIDGALLLVRWKQVVAAVCADLGVKLDMGVYDLPRILRVPGPPNLKTEKPRPTALFVKHQNLPLGLVSVHDSINSWFAARGADVGVPGADRESMRALMASPGSRQDMAGLDRIFTDAQAQDFLEVHAWAPARETPWGAGADYWKVLWQCAMVASHFADMYDEEDLREKLRECVLEGHGEHPDARDEYQIALGFAKGGDWYARRPTEQEQLNPFSPARDDALIAAKQGGLRAAGPVVDDEPEPTTEWEMVSSTGEVVASSAGQKGTESGTVVPDSGPVGRVCPFSTGNLAEKTATVSDKPQVGADRETREVAVNTTGRKLVFRQGSALDMEQTDWVWLHDRGPNEAHRHEHWIPAGELVILAGKPKLGKSQWAAKLAAWITTGKMEGKYRGVPRPVVFSLVEDSWPKTMLPRLAAAGADLSKCWEVRAAENEGSSGLALPVDMEALAEMVRKSNVGMIVLDPLTSVLDAKVDTHKDAATKKALAPLTELAQETGVVILGLMHFNKSGAGSLADRLMGSQAFSGTARAMLSCQPVDREGEAEGLMEGNVGPRQFLFGQVTNNLGPLVENSVRYEIRPAVVGSGETRINTSRVEVITFRDAKNVEDVALEQEAARARTASGRDADKAKDTKQGVCEAWMLGLLEASPRAWVDVKSMGEQLGYNDAMLRRVLAKLGALKSGEYHAPIYTLPAGDYIP